MKTASLEAIGLTPQQAAAYALLIETGTLKPAEAAKKLATSRTNAYKLFDKLVELKLASKQEVGKTFQYILANPLALASLAADYRAEATAREEAAHGLMNTLLSQYYEQVSAPAAEVVTGQKAVAELYRAQIKLGETIHFIRTRSDVPSMGFETMHEIRTMPSRHGIERKGILPVRDEQSTVNNKAHERTNHTPTYVEESLYSAPVEWSVTESSLLICTYGNEPHGILILDKLVPGAFLQLWAMLNSFLEPRKINKKLRR